MKTISQNGVHIAYDVKGKGPCVLLLHGFGDDRSTWAKYGWTTRLSEYRTVMTMDLRGCGESDKPESPSAYSIEAHLEDIEAVITAGDTSRPLVWGWSLGATLALHMAARGKVQATIAYSAEKSHLFRNKKPLSHFANPVSLTMTQWLFSVNNPAC